MTNRALGMIYLPSRDESKLLLWGSLNAQFESLEECFRKLGAQGGSIQLERQRFIAPYAGVTLICACSIAGNSSNGNGLRELRPLRFAWCCSGEEWAHIAALIGGLVGSPNAGHQYLNMHRDDVATVVVSKGEYSEDSFL